MSRREILEFLSGRGLPHRRDASNGDLRLLRNRLRRELALRAGSGLLERLASRVNALDSGRARLERELSLLGPAAVPGPGGALADAERLAGWPADLLRFALEEAARPYARPGRPPMTGREREQLIGCLLRGGDFRFEAGRRIRFERRGRTLSIRPAAARRA